MMLRAFCSLLLATAITGCAPQIDDEEAEDDFVEDLTTMPEDEGKADGTQRVSDYISRGCTTAPVLGLARQIAERMACLEPDRLQRFDESSDIHFTGAAILPFLHPSAADSLVRAAQAAGRIGVISAFRTLPQQYLLYKWRAARRCNISAAATPGRSNHETGRALDVDNPGAVRRAIDDYGWIANVAGDRPHFENLRSADGRGLDVLAFQELWNLNNPGDVIDTDGDWGPETERRLRNAPAQGFARSGCN